ncbi:MAG: DUF3606 domain-containing protein [Dongiaceae bacterium]
MFDDKSKIGGPERYRVNLTERGEIEHWKKKWRVTEQQLRDAVKQVGPMAQDVAKQLGKQL